MYRRISDDYLDPMNFLPESVIGIPHIYDVFRKGNVALLNAPGNGVADDKGIYYFVPKMIRYYLGEEPVLQNAPTYLPFYEEDMKYVLEQNLSEVRHYLTYSFAFMRSTEHKKVPHRFWNCRK